MAGIRPSAAKTVSAIRRSAAASCEGYCSPSATRVSLNAPPVTPGQLGDQTHRPARRLYFVEALQPPVRQRDLPLDDEGVHGRHCDVFGAHAAPQRACHRRAGQRRAHQLVEVHVRRPGRDRRPIQYGRQQVEPGTCPAAARERLQPEPAAVAGHGGIGSPRSRWQECSTGAQATAAQASIPGAAGPESVRKLRKKYGRAVLGAATAGLQQQFAALADAAERGRNLVPVRHFRLPRKRKTIR